MPARDLSPAPIEPLESRIAPSVIIGAGGRTAHYTDVDGDIVRIKISKGRLSPSDFLTMSNGASVPDGEQVLMINFADDRGEFNHANLTITAKPGRSGGDGHADIGSIDAGDGRTDLGKVSIDGNLGGIMAGDANTKTPGVKLLIAEAFTGYSGSVAGGIAKIKVAGDQTSGNSGATNNSGGSTVTGGSIIITGSSAGSRSSVVKTGTGTGNLGSAVVFGSGLGTITSGATLSISNSTSYLPVTSVATLPTRDLNILPPSNVLTPYTPTTGGTYSGAVMTIGHTLSTIDSSGVTFNGGLVISGSSTSIRTPTIELNSGSSKVATSEGESFVFTSTNLTLDAGSAVGATALTKFGAGTLQLTGNYSYTGATTIIAGTLVANPNSITGTASVNGGTLVLNSTSGAAYATITNTSGLTPLRFTGLNQVAIKVGDDTVGVGADTTLTFTADDGSAESSQGGALTLRQAQDGLSATLTLANLDPATAASAATAFDVTVNGATINIVQNHALVDKLIANGWTVSETVSQAGGATTAIKLTSPAAAVLPSTSTPVTSTAGV
jgi:autotransporter-associated beta strand protein